MRCAGTGFLLWCLFAYARCSVLLLDDFTIFGPMPQQDDEDILETELSEVMVPNVIILPSEDSFGGGLLPQDDFEPSENNINPTEAASVFPNSFDTRPPECDRLAIENLSEKVDSLMSEVKAQQDKISELERSNRNLQDKVDLIEQQTKTNSIIFFNISESKHEPARSTLQKVLHVINRVMKVKVTANNISVALRASSNATDNRPIVVRFTNFATKMKVLGARNKLSRTNMVVTGDYSEQVTKRRNDLLPYLSRARSLGFNAFLLYDKLVVNGVTMTLEELQTEDNTKKDESKEQVEDNRSGEQKEQDPDEQVEEVEVDPQFQDNEYE